MSETAEANGLSDRAGQSGTSPVLPGTGPSRWREIKHGPTKGGCAPSLPQEASLGVGVCSTHPGQF